MSTAELRGQLATLVADPDRLDAVAPADVPELLGALEVVRAGLWAKLQATAVAPSLPSRNGTGADRLLTVNQVAERLGVNRRWIYRHLDSLPFARKLAGGTLRFSERGLERYQEAQR